MEVTSTHGRRRCSWCVSDELLMAYHDTEWGVPVHGDDALFELLTLEGAQAGLSWLTILRRREGYRRAFARFEVAKVARFTDARIERILLDPGVVRHRQKVTSVVSNARAITQIQNRHGSLDAFLWEIGTTRDGADERARTMSKRLRTEGLAFVGPTVCLSFMQACGMVNHHAKTCFRYAELGAVKMKGPATPRR